MLPTTIKARLALHFVHVTRKQCALTLQDLNPLSFPVMLANCAGWVRHAFKRDMILLQHAVISGVQDEFACTVLVGNFIKGPCSV